MILKLFIINNTVVQCAHPGFHSYNTHYVYQNTDS